MRFEEKNHVLLVSHQGERLRIEAWGADSLRVRASRYREFTGRDWALTEDVPEEQRKAEIFISLPDGKKGDGTDSAEADTDPGELQMQSYATIQNGRLKIRVNGAGVISFYRDGKLFLREYYRNYFGTESKESCCLKIVGRDYKPIAGGDYGLTVRFESNVNEKLYGMGQYQQPYLDLKGCVLELAQRNSQISIPFGRSGPG